MSGEKKREADLHPIRVVARRTGLTPDLLRAWERRYGAVQPAKRSGRRLYNDADVERLILLRRASEAGRRIGQISGLSTAALNKLVSEDEIALERAPAPRSTARGRSVRGAAGGEPKLSDVLDICLEAVNDFDDVALESGLSTAMVAFGQGNVVEQVVLPLMKQIGTLWHEGNLRIAHEHLATAVVRSFLGDLDGYRGRASAGPVIVIATPVGQAHELGAMAAVSIAAAQGWQAVYLGPNLPAEEIAAAVRMKNASAVALSIVYPADDPNLHRELRKLRRLLPEGTPILVGGRAAEGYRASLELIQAVHADRMAEFRTELDEIRRQPSMTPDALVPGGAD